MMYKKLIIAALLLAPYTAIPAALARRIRSGVRSGSAIGP